jgi:hypothetical protein
MAQACLWLVGESRLAQILNAGEDVHTLIAGVVLGIDYETAKAQLKAEKKARSEAFEYFKEYFLAQGWGKSDAEVEATKRTEAAVPGPMIEARTLAKGLNFGFPGGLAVKSFPVYAWKAYKIKITEERTAECKEIWLETLPEFKKYFAAVGKLCGGRDSEGATFEHFVSGRVRGKVPYCATCNSFFQGLGADATGNACFLVSEACYVPTPCRKCGGSGCPWCHETGVSPLFGTRMTNYVHDEILLETPEYRAHEVAHELVNLMIEGAAPYLPDVPATAEPKIMRFWSKGAEQVWRDAVPGESFVLRRGADGKEKPKRLVAWPSG